MYFFWNTNKTSGLFWSFPKTYLEAQKHRPSLVSSDSAPAMPTLVSIPPNPKSPFPPTSTFPRNTKRPLAVLNRPSRMRAPYQLKQGQSRLFHRLPSGLGMEVIFQRGTRNDPDKEEEEEKSGPKNPPLVFIHGSFHAAWCWAEHWLPFFSGSGFDCYALSLLGQVFQLSSFYLSLGPFCELGFFCLLLNLWILLWVLLFGS